jgi:TatD DNase family protein
VNGYVDTHAHYDDGAFESDRLELIQKLFDGGIELIVDPAVDLKSSLAVIDISKRFPGYYCAVGIHPHEASDASDTDYETIRALSAPDNAVLNKIVAIGETGLDYHYDFSPRDLQADNFRKNIRIALDNCLPLIVHDREAHADTLKILEEENAFHGKVLFHCYSGSAEFASRLTDLGCWFSFGGAITFKNAAKFDGVLKAIPKERILPETDSPYMAPVPVRGTRNDSSNLKFIYARLSVLMGIDEEELKELMKHNAAEFFGLNKYK